ncbi:hypothetical protein Bbelb_111030 [Branchiostoma belcheri]|nr:hypothetical protein Bbelb_111030 [Branchiostoma belcheri]
MTQDGTRNVGTLATRDIKQKTTLGERIWRGETQLSDQKNQASSKENLGVQGKQQYLRENQNSRPRGYGHRNIPRLWRVTIAKDSGQASPAWDRHNVAWVPTKKNLGRKKYRDWDESKEQKEGRGPKGRENATSGRGTVGSGGLTGRGF